MEIQVAQEGVPRQKYARITLEFLRHYAKSKGGDCLSDSYLGIDISHDFRCANGHEWSARPSHILNRGRWCTLCGEQFYGIHNLNTFQTLAKNRGGVCLSEKYTGMNGRLKFRCADGHEWSPIARNIVHRMSWCPVCARSSTEKKIYYYLNLKNLVNEKNGRVISDSYLGDKINLEFECEDGHRWKTTPNSIKRGAWCPVCRKESRKAINKKLDVLTGPISARIIDGR